MTPGYWRHNWIPNARDDKWTILPERNMQTPSKSDLETLAIRLGCPPNLVDGGVTLKFYIVGGWQLAAGTRGSHGCCPSVPGWSAYTKDGSSSDPMTAFWSLWDSVGDLDPETKQAGRERNVTRGRHATPEATPPASNICRALVQGGGSVALAHRGGRTVLIVESGKAKIEIPVDVPTASINTDGTTEFSFTVGPSRFA